MVFPKSSDNMLTPVFANAYLWALARVNTESEGEALSRIMVTFEGSLITSHNHWPIKSFLSALSLCHHGFSLISRSHSGQDALITHYFAIVVIACITTCHNTCICHTIRSVIRQKLLRIWFF